MVCSQVYLGNLCSHACIMMCGRVYLCRLSRLFHDVWSRLLGKLVVILVWCVDTSIRNNFVVTLAWGTCMWSYV